MTSAINSKTQTLRPRLSKKPRKKLNNKLIKQKIVIKSYTYCQWTKMFCKALFNFFNKLNFECLKRKTKNISLKNEDLKRYC